MKFCRFCGKQLGDDEVCDCEESKKAAENAEGAENAAVIDSEKDSVKIETSEITEKIKKNKNVLLLIGGAIAACLFFIFIVSLFSANYKTPIKAIVKEINKGKKTDYLSLYTASLPKDLKKLNKEFYTELNEDRLEDLNEDLSDAFEELKEKYPKFKIKFDFDSSEKLTKTELKEYKDELTDGDLDDLDDAIDRIEDIIDDDLEDYADRLDVDEGDLEKFLKHIVKYMKSFKKIKITKGYKVRGRYILKNGSDEINKTDNISLIVLKINGNWVIYESRNGEKFKFNSEKKSYEKCNFLRNYINIFYKNAIIPNLF